MEVEYTGRQTDVPAKIRKLAERRSDLDVTPGAFDGHRGTS